MNNPNTSTHAAVIIPNPSRLCEALSRLLFIDDVSRHLPLYSVGPEHTQHEQSSINTRLDSAKAWLVQSRHVESPNCDARPRGSDIDMIVVHGISLPPGEFGGPWIEALFSNQLDPALHPYFASVCELRVSAHVLVRRDGEVVQFVPFTKRAWHCGESSFENRTRCNDFSIGIELEGVDEVPYADVQYAVLAEICRLVMIAWPAITPARVVGHCHVAPGRKSDPGSAFEWARLAQMLGDASKSTASTTG